MSPELDRSDKNTTLPEMDHMDSNILIFSSLGGGCAVAGVLFGIVVGIVVSKKKKRQESNIEMPLQPAGEGKYLIWWKFTKFSILILLSGCYLLEFIFSMFVELRNRKITISSLVDNTFRKPLKTDFDELMDIDKKRTGLMSDYMTIQGERFNDDKHGKLNLDKRSLPYDHTRVKLSRPVNGIDYINASWIQTLSRDRAYDELLYNDFLPFSKIGFILAQDPTKDLSLIHI